MTAKRQAFSLVELSIVLVILGLLVGGVLSGQSLIRAAQLRAVTTEYQRYTTAIGTFRDKYFALPGDMTNASAFGWLDGAGAAVSNGDGNGQITSNATANLNETSLFWVELADAGLIEGSYTMIAATTLTAGTNNPRSRMNNGGWNVYYLGTQTVTPTNYYENSYGNAFFFGGGTNVIVPTGILKSEEAWNIDTKLDDGKPQTGTVTTLESQGSATAGSGCGNAAAASTATAVTAYDLANTSATACSLIFKTGY